MKKLFYFLFLSIVSCKMEKEQQWVDSFECSSRNTKITPQMVEKSPGRYIGDCFTWYGKITDIKDSEPGMVWIVNDLEDDYDDNIDLVSTSKFGLQVNNDGNRSDKRFGNYSDISFYLGDTFHYSKSTDGIYEGDIVMIKGSVLGIAKIPNPFIKGRFVNTTQFVVYSISKLE